MFRQRTSSQKPGDDLLANFREQFPEVAAATSASTNGGPVGAGASAASQTSVAVASLDRTQALGHEVFRDQDPTPRATNDPWRFTPSLLDNNSFSFNSFSNVGTGYYPPTPGGTNTLYHPQAGDLHTPTLGLGMGMNTPLSMPTTDGTLHSSTSMVNLGGFQQGLHPQQLHHFNPFIQPPAPQPSFAPSTFVHHDTGYETMDQESSPMDSDNADERVISIDNALQGQTPMVGFQTRQFGMPMSAAIPLPPSAEKFRFHATLNAPTAMIKHIDEIPVTYLNKGQAYSLSIIDTAPSMPFVPGTRYRTYVRISFEDEQQRQKPGVCWSLWKEGRGTNEAHQRGGKLQAVEYVEAGQPPEGDDRRTRVDLESATFNGFSVIWTPGANGPIECNVAVRFNFLSTDFSHSKGVKGIPVRLCAKTHLLPPEGSQASPDSSVEICYCKVKLFRDHGAERKLSNDVAHVKKTIEKLKQQIAQAESGMKDFGKRKRTGSAQLKGQDGQRPGKLPKHKRTWSISSASSAGGGNGTSNNRLPLEEDLHFKLQTLQDMFTSTRPVSVLYLRGDELDDPDLHPVSLPGEPLDLTKVESKDSSAWRSERSSIGGSSLVSPSPSSLSLHSQVSIGGGNPQWQAFHRVGSTDVSSHQGSDQPVKVKQSFDEAGNLINWIEALGVDASYRPPPERSVKPVACFYVIRRNPVDSQGGPEYYRAVYLMQRTLQEFVSRVAAKWNINPAKVVRTIHVLERGLEVEMDDDAVQQIEEGQDITLEVVEVGSGVPVVKGEWDMAVDGPGDGEASQTACEFRLTY
ncbi:hypothetical protein VTK73DRAFT_4581 [Phialemonium thermophilum]|uniref:Grh/CP2 DB domain-containing protein n=1 Tax=Phialemonium thermophilum TaxID=223376 RepID=A0ABR3Y062_9PEZI